MVMQLLPMPKKPENIIDRPKEKGFANWHINEPNNEHFNKGQPMNNKDDIADTLYGWFSATQMRLCGTKTYHTPDGRTVELTLVSRTEDHGCRWDDVVFVGKVLANGFIDRPIKGELDAIDDLPMNEWAEKFKTILDREARCKAISDTLKHSKQHQRQRHVSKASKRHN